MGLEHFEQRSSVLLRKTDGNKSRRESGPLKDEGEQISLVSGNTKTYDVTALAVTLLVESVEGLPSQTCVAGDTRETLHVENLLHGDAAAAIADHVVAAAGAAT